MRIGVRVLPRIGLGGDPTCDPNSRSREVAQSRIRC
jgi:hypothetical protein